MAELTVYFFRHGITDRNEMGRMCGRTNALVSEKGWKELHKLKKKYEYPQVEKVFCSPAIRCRETASVLFPGQDPKIVENFWEYDFGALEDTPVDELAARGDFDKWLEQTNDCGYPEGESLLEAKFRAMAAMTRVVKECREQGLTKVAVVAHGEILNLLVSMAMETEEPMESFMLTPNGMGFHARLYTEDWFFRRQKMEFLGFLPEGAKRPKASDSPYFRK